MPDARYSDFSLTMQRHPVTGDIASLKNEDSVRNSIINTIRTSVYERFFYANRGAALKKYLFEPMNNLTSILISEEIQLLLENEEPRADILGIEVREDPERNGYRINVVFSLFEDILNENPIVAETFLRRA